MDSTVAANVTMCEGASWTQGPAQWSNDTEKASWNSTVSANLTGDVCGSISHETGVSLEDKIALATNQFFNYFVVPSGLVTNTISFLVMNLQHNRKSTICVQMSILAISDNILLAKVLLSNIALQTQLFPLSHLVCKINVYSHHIFTGFSGYVIVGMTSNRFFAIVYPHKPNIFSNSTRVHLFTLVTSLLILCFFCPLIFTAGQAHFSCTRFLFFAWYIDLYAVVMILMYPLLPVAFLFFFNISIIKALLRRRKFATSMRSGQQSKDSQVTVMLLLVSFLFIILVLPFEIYYASETERNYLLAEILFCLMLLNSCINFYLYLLSGSKFRNDLKRLFCCTNEETNVYSSSRQLSNSIVETSAHTQAAVSTVSI